MLLPTYSTFSSTTQRNLWDCLITSLPLMNGLACREQLAVFDVINYDIIKAVNYLPMYVLMVKLRPTGTKSKIKADLAYTR